jgi:hypothetical protein
LWYYICLVGNKQFFIHFNMSKLIFTFFFIICLNYSFAQIKADSIFIYYGMTQSAPEAPLIDYIDNLEKSGAKIQRLKTDEFDKIQGSFKGVKSKKYKAEKHKGTVYFVVFYVDGKKQFGAFDSSLSEAKFIDLTNKQIWNISDLGMIDKLYYALVQIH